ncbi:MAG TPA: glycosyltransferase family 39 protein [Pilimelia sp.]|nr:glycosyltransferase family 39 protein [Pilimelia sp.]
MSSGTLSHDAPVSVDTKPARTPTGRDPRWWLGLTACLGLAAVFRMWGAPDTSGTGNLYYTAAALSMSQDWTTFLTGGLDTSHFAAMDKPAVWLWPSALLIKAFGLNWATMFLPTAIAGTLSVLVLALAVREASGDTPTGRAAALLAALGLAISPMNVAIDRDNHPDAIMLLALLLAAWMAIRAVRRGALGPLLGAAALVGLAFNAKLLQAFIVLPAFALLWIVSGPGSIARRLAGLVGGGVTLAAASLAWPTLVTLFAAERPWISSSSDGTFAGRLLDIRDVHFSESPTSPNPMAEKVLGALHTGEAFHAGPPGPGRLFSGALADQVSWWIPLAVLAAVVVGLGLRGRRRQDPAVGALVFWSAWAVCCWAVFSLMSGTLHPYYTSMMVPALAALCATGLVAAWTSWRRGEARGAWLLTAQVLVASVWAATVLANTTARKPASLAGLVLGLGALAVVALFISRRPTARVGWVAVLVAAAMLAAPLTWSVKTADQRLVAFNPLGNQDGREGLATLPQPLSDGFLIAMNPPIDPRMIAFLKQNQGEAKWIVAALSAIGSTPITVASNGAPVMTMGGYYGTDPNPTVPQFQALVRAGDIRFVLAPPPGSSFVAGPAVDVTTWALRACKPINPITGGPAQIPTGPPPGQGPPNGQAMPPGQGPPNGQGPPPGQATPPGQGTPPGAGQPPAPPGQQGPPPGQQGPPPGQQQGPPPGQQGAPPGQPPGPPMPIMLDCAGAA